MNKTEPIGAAARFILERDPKGYAAAKASDEKASRDRAQAERRYQASIGPLGPYCDGMQDADTEAAFGRGFEKVYEK